MQKSPVSDNYRYGFREPEKYIFKSKIGLSDSTVNQISRHKSEPSWMRDFRQKSLRIFYKKPLPTWGGDLTKLDFNKIYYYLKPIDKKASSWEELPVEIKRTYDRIGVPEAEKKLLIGGVSAQYESEVVYKSIEKSLSKKGVIFLDMDSGLREYPQLVRQYFGTIIPPYDNKFAALNSAVWSGGSFIYVPKGVQVDLPLQAYFRINAANMGQFERTLIIADEGSFVHYVEGCLPAGEQISLGDKWVNIESVKPKDMVISEDGNSHMVKAIMVRNFKGPLITIRPVSPYNKFNLTPEHPVLAIKRNKVGRRIRYNWLPEVNTSELLQQKPEYIKAGELERGDFIIFPKIHPTGEAKFSIRELYLLGLYVAEGSTYIHNKLNMPIVSFSLNMKEKKTIKKIKQAIFEISGKKPMDIINKSKHSHEIRVYSQKLRDLCLHHCGKGAATKILSKEIMQISGKYLKIFLDAYWSGDGNILKRKGSVLMRAATVSENLARQLQELLSRLGVFASIQVRKGGEDYIKNRRIVRKTQYILTYTPNKKWTKVRETQNYYLVPIEEIVKTNYNGPVFNLDVAGLNSYLVRGFVVHNCTAPVYTTDSLHSAVVEIIVKKGARVRYTTIQNWSTNVYNLVTKRMAVYEEGIGEWIDGNLGCLTADTQIFANSKIHSIKQIKLGEYVYSLNSDLQIVRSKILAKKKNPPREVYKLTTNDFHEIESTNNHPFLVLRKIGKISTLSWKPLSELKVGDQVAVSGLLHWPGKVKKISFIPHRGIKQFKFPQITNNQLLWFLGFYIGDGYSDKTRVYIAVPEKDTSFHKIINLGKKFFGLTPEIKRNVIRYNSTKFVDFLNSLGFTGNAHTKKVPQWVYTLPQSQITAFINGYISADGYRRSNHKNISITSVNIKLLKQIKTLAYLTPFVPRKISEWVRKEKKPLGKEEKTYRHFFLYFGDEKKQAPVQFSKVMRIQYLGQKETYDIEVETGNFLANGFFVHNSKLTMKYPSVYLLGRGARGEILSVAYAGAGQHQDAGGKAIHVASDTTSRIISKSVSKGGGRTSYRGLLQVNKGAKNVKAKVVCDALILDETSRSDTYPTMKIDEDLVQIEHEATVSKIGEEQLFYLTSRGITTNEAEGLIVNGFIEPIVKELPLEYAVELNRLIELQMEGSVG